MNIDVFPFYNELDLLELRLATLEDVVDRWVISECGITYSGMRKPLFFKENRQRYKRWLSRIDHIVVPDYKVFADPWMNERCQRNHVVPFVKPKPDDIITYSDADEIPRPSVYRRFNPTDGLNALDMRLYVYYMNTRREQRWRYGKVCSGEYWNSRRDVHEMRCADLRSKWEDWGLYKGVLPLGGWHFTWLGTRATRRLKAAHTSHCRDKACADFLKQLANDPAPQCPDIVTVDRSWPKPVVENLKKYKDLGWFKEPARFAL